MERHRNATDRQTSAAARLREAVLLGVVCAIAGLVALHAQQKENRPATHSRIPEASSGNELASRLANAQAARSSGSPSAVAETNSLLIASASRELADVRAEQGAYPQAIELYKSSLAIESQPATILALATAEAHAGQFAEAAKLASRVHEVEPHNLQADKVRSSSLIQSGDFIAALEPLQRVAASDHSVETQYAFANCLLQTKRPADRTHAEQIFKSLAQENGDSGSLHVLIGRAYRDAGDLPSAIAQFQEALGIDPKTPHAPLFPWPRTVVRKRVANDP